MYLEERLQKILIILKHEKSISIKSLKNRLYVSEATLRRDLNKLEEKNLIQRTHGGAILLEAEQVESSINTRLQRQVKEKKMIADAAIKLIQPNSSLFIDSSSTVGQLLYLLSNFNHMTYITNGLNNALILSTKTNSKIYLPSGNVYTKTNSILGASAVRDLSNYYCDYFIFSASGLNEDGLFEASIEQKEIKQTMMNNSKIKICLIDHTKFDKSFVSKSFQLDDIDYIVTDQKPNNFYINLFKEKGIKLITEI